MYDIHLLENEEIIHIIDDVKMYEKDNYSTFTIILTNIRLFVLSNPSSINNSEEDLRCSGRISPIKKKEVIFKTYLSDITKVEKNLGSELKIYVSKDNYITINDHNIATIINHIMIYKAHSPKKWAFFFLFNPFFPINYSTS